MILQGDRTHSHADRCTQWKEGPATTKNFPYHQTSEKNNRTASSEKGRPTKQKPNRVIKFFFIIIFKGAKCQFTKRERVRWGKKTWCLHVGKHTCVDLHLQPCCPDMMCPWAGWPGVHTPSTQLPGGRSPAKWRPPRPLCNNNIIIVFIIIYTWTCDMRIRSQSALIFTSLDHQRVVSNKPKGVK